VLPVFELLVQQHPDYTDFRVQDDNWGWARKRPGASNRTLRIERTESLPATAFRVARRLVRRG
jgi:hypothetical protein